MLMNYRPVQRVNHRRQLPPHSLLAASGDVVNRERNSCHFRFVPQLFRLGFTAPQHTAPRASRMIPGKNEILSLALCNFDSLRLFGEWTKLLEQGLHQTGFRFSTKLCHFRELVLLLSR